MDCTEVAKLIDAGFGIENYLYVERNNIDVSESATLSAKAPKLSLGFQQSQTIDESQYESQQNTLEPYWCPLDQGFMQLYEFEMEEPNACRSLFFSKQLTDSTRIDPQRNPFQLALVSDDIAISANTFSPVEHVLKTLSRATDIPKP